MAHSEEERQETNKVPGEDGATAVVQASLESSAVEKSSQEQRQPNLAIGILIVLGAMGTGAYLANWFARVWIDWLLNPWSRKEIPMLFVTVTVNALIRSGEKARDQEHATNHNQQASGFSREHLNRVREKFFESLCAFRLIVGFPLWHVAMRRVTIVAVRDFGFREHFGFRFSLLLSIYIAFRFRSRVLHTMVPVFVVFYVWLLGGQVVADVVTFPLDLLWRLLDLVLLATLGSSLMRGLLLPRFLVGATSFGLELFWMLPEPTCFDEYFVQYRLHLNTSLAQDLPENRGLLSPWTGTCFEASKAELIGLVFSPKGVMKQVLFVLLAFMLIHFGVHSMLFKWIWEKDLALEELQRVLSNRDRAVAYAKSNPFRAKLHSDPKRFVSKTQQSPTFAQSIKGAIPDLGIKSSFQKLQTRLRSSLHEQVGERAKSITHVERVDTLLEKLQENLGKPDAYDILFDKVKISVSRPKDHDARSEGVFFQVADQLLAHSIQKLKNGLQVCFEGESGVDGGGLTAELFKLIADDLAPSECTDDSVFENHATRSRRGGAGLLKALPGGTLMLDADPSIELVYYYALGRLVGLAILHRTGFHLPLSSAMLKMMLDQEIDCEDVRALDPTYFENRMLLLLQPGGVETMKDVMDVDEIRFVWIDSSGNLGEELCPQGAHRILDEDNKWEYVQLLSEHYMCGQVREQLQIFLSGFHEIAPTRVLEGQGIDHIDLALLLRGALEIDVDDWEQHTLEPEENQAWTCRVPGNMTGQEETVSVSTADLVQWFWECVREMDGEHRTRLLQFSTGLSGPPVGGFRNLRPRKFNLCIDPVAEHLPSALTCFATLRIPLCPTKQTLCEKFDRICSQRHLTETFGEK